MQEGTRSTLAKFLYIGVCDRCGRPLKFAEFEAFGALRRFPCACACEVEEGKARELAEKEREQKRRLEVLFKQSRLGGRFRNASFDTFVVSNETRNVFTVMKDYAENFREKHKNTSILLFSNPGSGKTHLASAVINHLVKNGISAIFCVVPDLLLQIRSTFNDASTSEARILNGLAECQLLILDDLGSETHKSSEDWSSEKIYQVINRRYSDNKATIFTTNCNLEGLYNKLGRRTFSRMVEMCASHMYDLNNVNDYRLT